MSRMTTKYFGYLCLYRFFSQKKGAISDAFFQNSVIFYDYLNFKFADVIATKPT